ncbi:MAG: PDZ domain-containing protein [Polyangiaceae bacterium]
MIAQLGLFLCLFAGCARESLPDLIKITDVVPREVEVGDKLEIQGEGLPQGRTARVTFRGDLHRPGEAKPEHVTFATEGEVSASDRVLVAYTEDMQNELCGAGADAVHTTFEGSIEVAFPATMIAAPPVASTLAHASIDFRPPLPATSAAMSEGERMATFAGFQLVDREARGSGLGVASVDPGSRADRAGLRDGDEIESFNGVRALSVADLAMVEGARAAELGVHRTGGSETLTLDVEGFRPAPMADRFALLAALAVFALGLLLFASPASPRLLAITRRAHADGAAILRAPIAGWSRKQGVFASSLILAVALIAAPCAVEAFPSRIDVPLLFGGVALVSILIALASRGFVHGLRAIACHAGMACSMAGVVVLTGSLRVADIAASESALPWSWNIFHGPAGITLAIAFLVAAIASTALGESESPSALALETTSKPAPLTLADAFRLALACSLAALLFLGHPHAGAPRAISLAVTFAEAAGLFWMAAAARHLARSPWRLARLVPASAFSLALALAQCACRFDRRIDAILAWSTLAVAMLGAMHVWAVVRASGRASSALSLRPSPFL